MHAINLHLQSLYVDSIYLIHRRKKGTPGREHPSLIFCNWLGGTLSGQKRPIFRHTSQIFLTVAMLRPTKIRFVWQKMASFLSQTRPR
jgi:hypothetical protein